ncbi:hypothetical protein [Streptococcus gallolyticus]|uniref:Uncharacterized protein n=1 Tax=Streptococcus gallolyticus (strain UCN34) TaxID=637909 RepID=A0AA36NMJ5_STRG3|nr:hypothetical protein [Streptococcus gallolyticus]CBI13349.1 hypothetical protein GALLO_0857 [Streptococcus gallolyticus UCN34]
MSNRKKTIIISAIVVLLVLVTSFFGYRTYRYHDFKRAYEKGTTYEQLDVLMNNSRYIKKLDRLGYSVADKESLIGGVVPRIQNQKKTVSVYRPKNDKFEISYTLDEETEVYFELNQKLKMLDTYVMISDNGGIHYGESLTSSQQEKLLKVVKKELKTMLKTIYESMYD